MKNILLIALTLLSPLIPAEARAGLLIANRPQQVTSGGYNPLTAVANIKAWWGPDTSCTGAAGGAMVVCTDKSGNGNHLIPSILTGGSAPNYPGPTINGLSTVEMVRAGFQCGRLTSTGPTPPYTFYSVIQLTQSPAVNTCLFSNQLGQIWNLQGGVDEIYDNAHYLDVNAVSHTPGNTYFYAQKSDGTIAGTIFKVSDTPLTENSHSGTTFTGANIAMQNIGCADNGSGTAVYGADMLMGDTVLYGSYSSDADDTAAYAFYKPKWNTQ